MTAAKKQRFKLPVSIGSVTSAIGVTSAESTQELTLSLVVDRSIDADLLAYAKQEFRPASDNLKLSLKAYQDEPASVDPESDLLVILANDARATPAVVIAALKARVPAVIVTRDAALLEAACAQHFGVLEPQMIISLPADSEDLGLLFERLGAWIVRKLPKIALPLARNLGFVRMAYTSDCIRATSLQNAAIAAAFFIPGADLPVLTLNQMKMFLQIAATYQLAIDNSRLTELVLIAASGLGFRALARRVVGLVPVFGWALKAGIGYGATFALGELAIRYFEEGGDIKEIACHLKPPVPKAKPSKHQVPIESTDGYEAEQQTLIDNAGDLAAVEK